MTHLSLKRGGIGTVIGLTIMLILFLIALVTMVRLVNVQQNIAQTTNKIVQKALSAAGGAQFCADLYRVCAYTQNGVLVNLTTPQPWLALHCAPASYVQKIQALQVQVDVYDTATGKKETYVLLLPKRDFKFFPQPTTIEYSPTPVTSCSLVTNPSALDNVVGYINGTVIAKMTGLTINDLLGLTDKQVKIEVTYFLVNGIGWIRKAPCGSGSSSSEVVVAAVPSSGGFIPSVNIRPLKLFTTQYAGVNYQYALTKPLTEPLYVGECFEVQLYFPAQWLQSIINVTGTNITLEVAKGTIEVFDEWGNNLVQNGNVVLTQYGPVGSITIRLGNISGVAASYLLCYQKKVPQETLISLYAKIPIIVGNKTMTVIMSLGSPLKLSPLQTPPTVSMIAPPGSPSQYCPPPKDVVGDDNAYVIALMWNAVTKDWRNAVPTAVFLNLRDIIEKAVPDPTSPLRQYEDMAYLRGIFVDVWEGTLNPSLYPLNWTFTQLPTNSTAPVDQSSGVLTFLAKKPSGFTATGTNQGAICLYLGIKGISPANSNGELGDGKWPIIANLTTVLNGQAVNVHCYAPMLNQTFKICYLPYSGPNAETIATANAAFYNLQPSIDSTVRAITMKVFNPNTFDLVNFQARVELPPSLKGVPITIRDSKYNLVPFCYETITGECTTDYTKGDGYIWVKLPYVPKDGTAYLSVYTGQNGAVPGDQVFVFYDDFNNYSNLMQMLDSGKWSIAKSLTGGGSCYCTGFQVLTPGATLGQCHIIPEDIIGLQAEVNFVNGTLDVQKDTCYGVGFYANNLTLNTSQPFVVEARVYDTQTNQYRQRTLFSIGVLYNDTKKTSYLLRAESDYGRSTYYAAIIIESGAVSCCGQTVIAWSPPLATTSNADYFDKWYDMTFIYDGNKLTGTVKVEGGNTYTVSYKPQNLITKNGTIVLNFEWDADGYEGKCRPCVCAAPVCTQNKDDIRVDWVRVRKWAPSQPTVQFINSTITSAPVNYVNFIDVNNTAVNPAELQGTSTNADLAYVNAVQYSVNPRFYGIDASQMLVGGNGFLISYNLTKAIEMLQLGPSFDYFRKNPMVAPFWYDANLGYKITLYSPSAGAQIPVAGVNATNYLLILGQNNAKMPYCVVDTLTKMCTDKPEANANMIWMKIIGAQTSATAYTVNTQDLSSLSTPRIIFNYYWRINSTLTCTPVSIVYFLYTRGDAAYPTGAGFATLETTSYQLSSSDNFTVSLKFMLMDNQDNQTLLEQDGYWGIKVINGVLYVAANNNAPSKLSYVSTGLTVSPGVWHTLTVRFSNNNAYVTLDGVNETVNLKGGMSSYKPSNQYLVLGADATGNEVANAAFLWVALSGPNGSNNITFNLASSYVLQEGVQFTIDGVTIQLSGTAAINSMEKDICPNDPNVALIYFLNKQGSGFNSDGTSLKLEASRAVIVLRRSANDTLVQLVQNSGLPFFIGMGYYEVKVKNPNNESLTNFQVRIKLPPELNQTYIRVYNNGQALPFCYETFTGECTTNPAQGDGYIWVKIPYISANGTTTLLIAVTDASNNGAVTGDKVFIFYDDFNNGFDSTKYTLWGTYTSTNGEVCLVRSSSGFSKIEIKNLQTNNALVEGRFIVGSPPYGNVLIPTQYENYEGAKYLSIFADPDFCGSNFGITPFASSPTHYCTNVSYSGYHILGVWLQPQEQVYYIDNKTVWIVHKQIPPLYITFLETWKTYTQFSGYCADWIRIREYAPQQPIIEPVGWKWIAVGLNNGELYNNTGIAALNIVNSAAPNNGVQAGTWAVYQTLLDPDNEQMVVWGTQFDSIQYGIYPRPISFKIPKVSGSLVIVANKGAELGELRVLEPSSAGAFGIVSSQSTAETIQYGSTTSNISKTLYGWFFVKWSGANNFGVMLNPLSDYIMWFYSGSASEFLSGVSGGDMSAVIKVYNPNTVALTDYQVRIKLPSSLKGVPITVKSGNNPSVPFCYETITGECTTDYTKGDGYIWVKVPYMPPMQNVTLILTAGQNGAVPGDQVFDSYDDFSSYNVSTGKTAPLQPIVYYSGSEYVLNEYYNNGQVMPGLLYVPQQNLCTQGSVAGYPCLTIIGIYKPTWYIQLSNPIYLSG